MGFITVWINIELNQMDKTWFLNMNLAVGDIQLLIYQSTVKAFNHCL